MILENAIQHYDGIFLERVKSCRILLKAESFPRLHPYNFAAAEFDLKRHSEMPALMRVRFLFELPGYNVWINTANPSEVWKLRTSKAQITLKTCLWWTFAYQAGKLLMASRKVVIFLWNFGKRRRVRGERGGEAEFRWKRSGAQERNVLFCFSFFPRFYSQEWFAICALITLVHVRRNSNWLAEVLLLVFFSPGGNNNSFVAEVWQETWFTLTTAEVRFLDRYMYLQLDSNDCG